MQIEEKTVQQGALREREQEVRDYFRRSGTVSTWWDPDQDAAKHFFLHELKIFDRLVSDLPRDFPVLDACTGRGRFAIRLAELGFKNVGGIDISEEMLGRASENAKQHGVTVFFRHDEAEKLSTVEDDSTSMICLMEAFDHIPDTQAALSAIHRKLKRDGILIGTFVNSKSLYGLLFSIYRRICGKSKMIAQTFSPDEFTYHLKQTGFALEKFVGVELLNLPHTRIPLLRRLLFPSRLLGRLEGMLFDGYHIPFLARRSTTAIFVARRIG